MYINLNKINWELSYVGIKNLFEFLTFLFFLTAITQYIARPSND